MNEYDWTDSNTVADKAVRATRDFIFSKAATVLWDEVKAEFDVSQNKYYQKRDTDLLLIVRKNSLLTASSIEVKGDNQHKYGNFFLETISDVSRNTPGAFIVCEAEWYFYYFLGVRTLYCLPMTPMKEWFNSCWHELEEKITSTKRGGRRWQTKGRPVAIKRVINEVRGVHAFKFERLLRQWLRI